MRPMIKGSDTPAKTPKARGSRSLMGCLSNSLSKNSPSWSILRVMRFSLSPGPGVKENSGDLTTSVVGVSTLPNPLGANASAVRQNTRQRAASASISQSYCFPDAKIYVFREIKIRLLNHALIFIEFKESREASPWQSACCWLETRKRTLSGLPKRLGQRLENSSLA